MGGNSSTEHINEAMNSQVAKQQPVATVSEVRKAFPVSDTLRYVKNDTYIGDPLSLLGRVYYEKRKSSRLFPFLVSLSAGVEEKSVLKAPQTVSEIIVDSKISAEADILSMVSLNLNHDEVFELRVVNNAAARLIDRGDTWDLALTKWLANPLCQQLINDPDVGTISVVTGVVQKYMTSKKYRKFEAGTKGGGWGVNVAGNLYTSSSEFQLDIVYGLDLVSFGTAKDVNEFAENLFQGIKVTEPAQIANVNRLFDSMARELPSIFRMSTIE